MRARVLGLGWVTPGGLGRGADGAGYGFGDAPLPELERKALFAEPYPRYGRLDALSRLGLAGIALALADAGLDRWQEKRTIGIVAGSRCGCLATDLDYFKDVLPEGGGLASPNLFAYTLPNTMLGEAAIRFGLTGPGYVISAADAGFAPLEVALETLASGAATAMLAGFCELPPGDFGWAGAPSGTTFLVLAPAATAQAAAPELELDEYPIIDGTPVTTWQELVAAVRRDCGGPRSPSRGLP